MYACAQCQASAKVENGRVVRSCGHDAPVIASIKAHARGRSATGQKSVRQRILGKLSEIARNLKLGG